MSGIQITTRAPIYRDSAFVFENIEQAERAFQAESLYPQSGEQYFYTRYANPTIIDVERELANIEGSAWAALTSSGMSAIDTVLSILQKQGKTGTWLFLSEIYGGTKAYINEILVARRGVHAEFFAPTAGQEKYDLTKLIEALDRIKPQVLYFEPIANPLLIVADGNAIIQAAKARGITVVIDNTFATPYVWRPLASGADIVVHSATKYLSGHGNVTGGVICGNDDALRKEILQYRKLVGHILSPDDAYRVGTQAKTFELRVAKQCENAYKLAHLLAAHDKVTNVRYPGLASHQTYQEAVNTFGDKFGAMITFELTAGRQACDAFIAAISSHVKFMTTLGDPETILVHVPTVFTAERFPFPGMLRLSVGFEPYHALETHFLNAFAAI